MFRLDSYSVIPHYLKAGIIPMYFKFVLWHTQQLVPTLRNNSPPKTKTHFLLKFALSLLKSYIYFSQGNHSTSQGFPCITQGNHSISQGSPCIILGNHSIPQGFPCIIQGNHSTPQGSPCIILGNHSTPQGNPCIILGNHRTS